MSQLSLTLDTKKAEENARRMETATRDLIAELNKFSSVAAGVDKVTTSLGKLKTPPKGLATEVGKLATAVNKLDATKLDSLSTSLERLSRLSVDNAAASVGRLAVSMANIKNPKGLKSFVDQLNRIKSPKGLAKVATDTATIGNNAGSAQKTVSGLNTALSKMIGTKAAAAATAVKAVGDAANKAKPAVDGLATATNKIKPVAGSVPKSVAGIGDSAKRSENAVLRLATSMNRVTGLGTAFAGAFAVSGIARASRAVFGYSKTLLGLESALFGVLGSQKAADEQLKFVKALAREAKFDVLTLANSYRQLTAATFAAGVPLEQSNKLFRQFVVAGRSLNQSNEDVKLSFLALSQIFSKGKVSMEELRRQLGERLPGALQLMAKALGVSTAKLNEMVSNGQVSAIEILKLGNAVESAFGGSYQKALAQGTAAVEGLISELKLLAGDNFGRAFFEEISDAVNAFTKSLQTDTLKEFASALGTVLGGAVVLVTKVLTVLADNIDLVMVAAQALAVIKLAKTFLAWEVASKAAAAGMTLFKIVTIATRKPLLALQLLLGTSAAGMTLFKIATIATRKPLLALQLLLGITTKTITRLLIPIGLAIAAIGALGVAFGVLDASTLTGALRSMGEAVGIVSAKASSATSAVAGLTGASKGLGQASDGVASSSDNAASSSKQLGSTIDKTAQTSAKASKAYLKQAKDREAADKTLLDLAAKSENGQIQNIVATIKSIEKDKEQALAWEAGQVLLDRWVDGYYDMVGSVEDVSQEIGKLTGSLDGQNVVLEATASASAVVYDDFSAAAVDVPPTIDAITDSMDSNSSSMSNAATAAAEAKETVVDTAKAYGTASDVFKDQRQHLIDLAESYRNSARDATIEAAAQEDLVQAAEGVIGGMKGRLTELQNLHEAGLISTQQYETESSALRANVDELNNAANADSEMVDKKIANAERLREKELVARADLALMNNSLGAQTVALDVATTATGGLLTALNDLGAGAANGSEAFNVETASRLGAATAAETLAEAYKLAGDASQQEVDSLNDKLIMATKGIASDGRVTVAKYDQIKAITAQITETEKDVIAAGQAETAADALGVSLAQQTDKAFLAAQQSGELATKFTDLGVVATTSTTLWGSIVSLFDSTATAADGAATKTADMAATVADTVTPIGEAADATNTLSTSYESVITTADEANNAVLRTADNLRKLEDAADGVVAIISEMDTKIGESVESAHELTGALETISENAKLAAAEALQFTINLGKTADAARTAGRSISRAFDTIVREARGAVNAINQITGALNAVTSAANAAVQAIERVKSAQASSSSGGSGSGDFGSGRNGGVVGNLPQTQTVSNAAFANAPHLAAGIANTNALSPSLPGGGIPSVIHPGEAVVPLSGGRSIPVSMSGGGGGPTSVTIDKDQINTITSRTDVVQTTVDSLKNDVLRSTTILDRNMRILQDKMGAIGVAIDRLGSKLTSSSSSSSSSTNTSYSTSSDGSVGGVIEQASRTYTLSNGQVVSAANIANPIAGQVDSQVQGLAEMQQRLLTLLSDVTPASVGQPTFVRHTGPATGPDSRSFFEFSETTGFSDKISGIKEEFNSAALEYGRGALTSLVASSPLLQTVMTKKTPPSSIVRDWKGNEFWPGAQRIAASQLAGASIELGAGPPWNGAIGGFARGTPNTSREGMRRAGGGFPTMVHDNEAIIPLPDGRSVPVKIKSKGMQRPTEQNAGQMRPIVVNIQIDATDVDSFDKSKDQLTREMAAAIQSATRDGEGVRPEFEDPTKTIYGR